MLFRSNLVVRVLDFHSVDQQLLQGHYKLFQREVLVELPVHYTVQQVLQKMLMLFLLEIMNLEMIHQLLYKLVARVISLVQVMH